MKIEETEILVVGAGPAGLIAAREASQRGAEVTVLEEDSEIGFPCHCAGLLSLKGLEKIGVPDRGTFIQNKVRGAHFFSPSGLTFTVEKDEFVACVVDRALFDRFLARQATEAGARIKLNSKVRSIERIGGGIVTRGEQESGRAKIIVDAEGASSGIVKAAGLKPLNHAGILPGLQFDLEGVSVEPDYVEVYMGRRIAPGFFAWIIPLSENSARVGLGCKGANPKERLEKFVKDHFGEGDDLERVAARSGVIVTCGPIEKTFDDNLLIVGDAAGQVKPTTGGGVVLGGLCASSAGEIAAAAMDHKDLTATFLARYESIWRSELGGELRTALWARKVMNRLSDKTLDKLFEVIIKNDLQGFLSAEGDMDFQRGVLLKLFMHKEVLRILPSFLGAFSPFRRKING
ncbi:MAG: NAD(P)/FAD-dependent oxidoreductase [Candidatus Bathyarchaeota archaeon]|nr:NAD(P)/FAD-dependent oxidoreductase [Candidatus Bathyarchaeota archaeon]